MLRLCLCLMIAMTSATVAAREVRLSAADSGDCPSKATATAKTPAVDAGASATPARPGKSKPSVHGDASPSGRLQSPRWHSFLPGMFR